MTGYDRNNIFARILRGEISCQKVYEDDHVLAFLDIHPKAKTHVLVIPKGAYCNFSDFAGKASEAEILAYVRAVGMIADQAGISKSGYRLIANAGGHGGQEVPHLHVHILGGEDISGR